jgi:hypothetical protein
MDEDAQERLTTGVLLAGATLVYLAFLAWRSTRAPFGWWYGAMLLGPVALGLILLAAGRTRAALWVGLAPGLALAVLWLIVQVFFMLGGD